MLFPFPSIWSSRDIDDPGDQIDRHLADRTHRLIVGLSVNNNFEFINGSLVVCSGRGKFLRVRHSINQRIKVPTAIAERCRKFENHEETHFGELQQLLFDLSLVQAELTEQLKRQAGKYVDRLLAVAVSDPGLWFTDFDGQLTYSGLCGASQLSDITGLTVIDEFPARDVSAGGNGKHLEALPLWLLLADRNPRVAQKTTAAFLLGDTLHCFLLPASDGLDAVIPPIQVVVGPGKLFLDVLVSRWLPNPQQLHGLELLYADGTRDETVVAKWKKTLAQILEHQESLTPVAQQNLAMSVEEIVGQKQLDVATIVHSGISFVMETGRDGLRAKRRDQVNPPDQVWIASDEKLQATAVSQLTRVYPRSSIDSLSTHGLDRDATHSVIAAIMGLMHIDQMQINIPWLTGAKQQKVLGRIAPGSPANWQLLLRDMTDFQPPSMLLKNAI